MAKSFKVKMKKSWIGATKDQKATLTAIGVRRIGQEAVLQDNPANRGQIMKVQRWLDVKVEK